MPGMPYRHVGCTLCCVEHRFILLTCLALPRWLAFASRPTLWQLEKSAVYPGVGGRMADAWDEVAIKELSRHPRVERAFGLGSVLAVEMKAADRG